MKFNFLTKKQKWLLGVTFITALVFGGLGIRANSAPVGAVSGGFWKVLSSEVQPSLNTWTIRANDDLDFYDEIQPDGSTCSNGEILKKTGADDWDCAADNAGGGDGLATSTPIADTEVVWGTGIATVGSEAAFTYDDALNVLTYSYGSTTAVTATDFFGALTGNADTATALAANGGNCASGEIALGVDASGVVEGCYEPVEADITDLAHYTTLSFAGDLAGTTTDALTQGSTNLYNQTHTGEVTGATGLTIAVGAVETSNILDETLLFWDFATSASFTDEDILLFNEAGGNLTGTSTLGLNRIPTCAEITGSADLCDGGDATGADTNLTEEEVEDFAGALIASSSGAHDILTIAYQDATSDIDFTVDVSGDWTGTLDTINGADFFTEAEYIASTTNPYITTMTGLTLPYSQLSGVAVVTGDITDETILVWDIATSAVMADNDILTFNSAGGNITGLTCAEITGSADLCDGDDATGGGASLHVDGGGFVYPQTGDTHKAPSYEATSTGSVFGDFISSASSTVTGELTVKDEASGTHGEFDLTVGLAGEYGGLIIGNTEIYSSSFSASALDLDKAFLFRQNGNIGAGNDPGIEFAFMEQGNTVRLAIPESAAGNAMNVIRSLIVAGPYAANVGNNIVTCVNSTGSTVWNFWDIDCDTSGTGPDLGVLDDFQVLGNITTGGTITASSTITFETLSTEGVVSVSSSGVLSASSTISAAFIDTDLSLYNNATSDFFDTAGTGMTSSNNTVNVIGGNGVTANANDLDFDCSDVTDSGADDGVTCSTEDIVITLGNDIVTGEIVDETILVWDLATSSVMADNDILTFNSAGGNITGNTLAELSIQPLDSELTTIAGLTETNGGVMFVAGGLWTTDTTPAIDCTDCTNVPAGSHAGTITWTGTSILESGAAFQFGDASDATLTHTYANTGTNVDIAYSTGAMAVTGSLTATNLSGTNTGDNDEVGTKTTGDLCVNDGSSVNCTVNTEAELETALDALNVLTVTADDVSSANLLTLISDETGTGVAVFGTNPTLTGAVLNGVIDAGGATSFELPNATDPTVNAIGEISLDTTSGNIIFATSTTGVEIVAASATTSLYGFNIASTSADFVSGGIIEMPSHFLAQEALAIICDADAGTSVQIFLSDGTNDTNTITCTTTSTQFALTANSAFTAYEDIRIELGTISGTVDRLSVHVIGYRISD